MKRLVMVLGMLLFIFPFFISNVSGADFSRYRPQAIKELIQRYPPRPGLTIITNMPIRSKVRYLGQFRDLPDDTRRLIAAWAESINAAEVPSLFRRELKIEEAGIEYWVPVQEVLVSYMKAELHPREVIELFILFIGQVDGRHGFLVNEFEHESTHDDPRKKPIIFRNPL